MREGQTENPIGILLVDILLCSSFPIISRSNILNNRTILIDNLPHFSFLNLGEATDEIVNVHFLSLFLSLLLLISTFYGRFLKLQAYFFGFFKYSFMPNNKIISIILWHSICYTHSYTNTDRKSMVRKGLRRTRPALMDIW
jgi:hypothetical protein